MKPHRILPLLALLALPSHLVACSSSSSATTATPASCTGTPHGQGETFPVESEADLAKYPECSARCGAAKVPGGPFFPIEALPTGSCSAAASCAMAVQYFCGCPSTTGPVNGFRCDCVGGTWRCVIAQQGGAVCPAGCADAGTDHD